MAGFLFRLETVDGVAADPPTLEAAVRNWKPGDSIYFGAGLVPGAAFVRGRDIARWRLAMPDACARVGDPGRFLFAVPLPLSASAPVFSESHAAEEALERRHHVGSIRLSTAVGLGSGPPPYPPQRSETTMPTSRRC